MNRLLLIVPISCMLSAYKVIGSNIVFNIIDGNPELIFQNINAFHDQEPVGLVIYFCIATTIFPLLYEVMFRGLLWGMIRSFADKWTTGILVAVAYSAFGIIVNFPFLLPFALYLSYLRHTRDSIWPGVFANSVFVASNIFIPFLF